MLLHVWCRPGGALLTVSPLLLGGAAFPGAGFLLLLGLMLAAAGETAILVFFGFCLFLFGVMAYAFWRAASSQLVRCRREGQRVHVVKRGANHQADARDLSVEVTKRTVGMQGKVTLHEVNLVASGLDEPVTIHSGLTRWGASRAASRVREHLGLR